MWVWKTIFAYNGRHWDCAVLHTYSPHFLLQGFVSWLPIVYGPLELTVQAGPVSCTQWMDNKRIDNYGVHRRILKYLITSRQCLIYQVQGQPMVRISMLLWQQCGNLRVIIHVEWFDAESWQGVSTGKRWTQKVENSCLLRYWKNGEADLSLKALSLLCDT